MTFSLLGTLSAAEAAFKEYSAPETAPLHVWHQHRCMSYAAQVGKLEHGLRTAAAELAAYRGEGAKPQAGCEILPLPFLGGEMLVEVEDGTTIVNVLVNGQWVNPEDAIGAGVLKQWDELLAERAMEAAL